MVSLEIVSLDMNLFWWRQLEMSFVFLFSKTMTMNWIVDELDDELSIFKDYNGPQMEKIKKHLQKVFKNNGLDVIIECNMKVGNYLHVTFNLNDDTYLPYQKPDNIIQYIQVESNHPPNIIKQISKQLKNTSPSSPPMKKYLMNQHPSMKSN